jgi:hypothetical protein
MKLTEKKTRKGFQDALKQCVETDSVVFYYPDDGIGYMFVPPSVRSDNPRAEYMKAQYATFNKDFLAKNPAKADHSIFHFGFLSDSGKYGKIIKEPFWFWAMPSILKMAKNSGAVGLVNMGTVYDHIEKTAAGYEMKVLTPFAEVLKTRKLTLEYKSARFDVNFFANIARVGFEVRPLNHFDALMQAAKADLDKLMGAGPKAA